MVLVPVLLLRCSASLYGMIRHISRAATVAMRDCQRLLCTFVAICTGSQFVGGLELQRFTVNRLDKVQVTQAASFHFFRRAWKTCLMGWHRLASYHPLFCDITWGAGGSTADLTLDIANKMQNAVSTTEACQMPEPRCQPPWPSGLLRLHSIASSWTYLLPGVCGDNDAPDVHKHHPTAA